MEEVNDKYPGVDLQLAQLVFMKLKKAYCPVIETEFNKNFIKDFVSATDNRLKILRFILLVIYPFAKDKINKISIPESINFLLKTGFVNTSFESLYNDAIGQSNMKSQMMFWKKLNLIFIVSHDTDDKMIFFEGLNHSDSMLESLNRELIKNCKRTKSSSKQDLSSYIEKLSQQVTSDLEYLTNEKKSYKSKIDDGELYNSYSDKSCENLNEVQKKFHYIGVDCDQTKTTFDELYEHQFREKITDNFYTYNSLGNTVHSVAPTLNRYMNTMENYRTLKACNDKLLKYK